MDVVAFDLADHNIRERYDRLFEACPAAFIQQSSYWADVIKDLGPDKPIFLLCGDGGKDLGGLPLYLYEHRLGNILTSVPQAGPLGGIFFREGLSEREIDRVYASLLEKAKQLGEENHCLALSIITNPFFQDLALYQCHLSPTYEYENFTQYIPLTEIIVDGEITLRDYNRRSNLSRNVRKAKASGFSVGLCETDTEWDAWYQVHERRHRELGISPLSPKLFENIRRVLGPRTKAHLLLVKREQEIASGCLYIRHCRVMDVFMLSMDAKFADQVPNFLNTEHSLSWARKLGAETYNWQSSPDRASGVFGYKKQWGSAEASYSFVTKLFCRPEEIERIGLETIKREYAWHYVVPFAAFHEGFNKKNFRKA